jgi:hypothetical protein
VWLHPPYIQPEENYLVARVARKKSRLDTGNLAVDPVSRRFIEIAWDVQYLDAAGDLYQACAVAAPRRDTELVDGNVQPLEAVAKKPAQRDV